MKTKLYYFSLAGIRIFLGIIFFTAGMSKLMHGMFPGIIGPVWLEEELAKYGLGLYAEFIAISQAIAGLLLLTLRFSTIGAILLFPIILNILMVTISLEWRGTPYVNAFLLLLNVILIAADYHKLKFLLFDNALPVKSIPLKRRNLKLDLIWISAFMLIILSPLFISNYTIVYILVIASFAVFIICHYLDLRFKKK